MLLMSVTTAHQYVRTSPSTNHFRVRQSGPEGPGGWKKVMLAGRKRAVRLDFVGAWSYIDGAAGLVRDT